MTNWQRPYKSTPYQMQQVTVNPGPGFVRYIMVESPMEHDEFKSLYRQLGQLGIMVPMTDLANCALTGISVIDSHAGASWRRSASKKEFWRAQRQIDEINRIMQTSFSQISPQFPFAYKVVEYCDGLLVLEIRALVNWNELNRYQVAA